MPFLEPRKTNTPHRCTLPGRVLHAEGTRWKCDECGAVYCLQSIRDRGVSELSWIRE